MQALDEIYNDARKKLETRLTQYRLLHSISVADIASLMANVYEVDQEHARVAGLLHDWDKNYNDEELTKRAKKFGVEVPNDMGNLAALLHAQTGARAVAKEYPALPQEIIQAIERHTSAATDMTDLDMIIYVADMIEPMRSAPSLVPLRSLAGNVPLEELFIKCYQATLEHLIRRRRYIHPDSIEVWNTYAAKERVVRMKRDKQAQPAQQVKTAQSSKASKPSKLKDTASKDTQETKKSVEKSARKSTKKSAEKSAKRSTKKSTKKREQKTNNLGDTTKTTAKATNKGSNAKVDSSSAN